MSESSDTGQASIVFLGRESFRMQVVGADAGGTTVGAIPTAIWEGPTARIIERRNFERRHGRRVEPEAATAVIATPAPAPARKNVIIGISLLAFACGIALATAANRMARPGSERIAQLERRAPVAPPQAVAPAIIVQPLSKPEEPPAPAPVAVVETVEPAPAKLPAMAKAAPAPRAVAARVARPRRINPAVRASDLEADDPFDAPPARPGPRKWVDPFAE